MSQEQPSLTSSSAKEFRHALIQEFRESLAAEKYEIPSQVDGVVVLSAAGLYKKKTERPEQDYGPEDAEDIARIGYAIDIIRQYVAKQLDKSVDEITEEDFRTIDSVPTLILNGETEQLPAMQEVAVEQHFPLEKIRLIDCGPNGVGNTKTQFSTTADDAMKNSARYLVFVTSGYHTPRVERTAAASLPENLDYDIIGVPYEDFSYNIFSKVHGEIKRIEHYAKKGEIAVQPRSK